MTFDLFISHSSKDNDITRKIRDRLTAAGVETWVDYTDIHAGDMWDAKIQEALNNAKRAVIVLSRASLASTHCRGEWETLVERKVPIFVLKIEALTNEEISYYLKPTQITDLTLDVEAELAAVIAKMTGTSINVAKPRSEKKISGGFPKWHLDIPLYGREDNVSKVRAALSDENSRHIVQITGIGGVGKTRLAAEMVKLSDYVDGVIWHDCRIASLTTLAATLREHLGLPVITDEQTWDELDKHTLLIVLDNGEDCPEPAAYSATINQLGNNARVILTSRMRWNELKRATEFSLNQPDFVAAGQIMREFTQKKAGQDVGESAVTLAEAAYRHPRLMEYAASWLNDMSIKDVLAELKALKSPDAQEALNEMIRRSVERVRNGTSGEIAITVLRKLAVCRGGFTSEAAKAIAGEDNFTTVLKCLRNWGLLRYEGERYEVDPLIIETLGEDEAAHRAHLEYYKILAEQHDEQQDYFGLNVESANLETAFEWAVGTDNAELSYWFANACANFQANRGRYVQSMGWFKRVELMITEETDEYIQASFANSWGEINRDYPLGNRRNNLQLAIVAYEQALRFFTPDSAPLDYAMVQNNLGNAYGNLAEIEVRSDNLQCAITAYEQALRFWTPDNYALGYSSTQNNLGIAYRKLSEIGARSDNLQRAITAYEQALCFCTPDSAPLDYAQTQNNLGAAYRSLAAIKKRKNNLRRAIVAYKQALRFYTPDSAPLDYAQTQINLGNAYVDLAAVKKRKNNLRRAIVAYKQTLRFYTPDSRPLDYAIVQQCLGNIYVNLAEMKKRRDDLKRAIMAYEQALRFHTPDNDPLEYAGTQHNLGLIHKHNGDTALAIRCWCEAEKYYRLMDAVEEAEKIARWIAAVGGMCE